MALNIQNTNLRISAGLLRQFPGDPIPQIAFSGRSNVGKSSLINTLLGRKSLTRVSKMPGKTITINFYDVDKKMFFVDLPGYGFARRAPQEAAQWRELTDSYFTKNPNLDRLALVMQLIDSRVGPTEDDVMMLDFLRASNIPYVVIATKCDKLNATERKASETALASHPAIGADTPIIFFSSLKGDGKAAVWQQIAAHTGIRCP
ncbi:MAG: YihA family ribosome biogenesis GTP-binding protein [Ruminococcaceae bacterium]|nr:YihA family ribosome biogenesis GTP-binding protein [Oscillospiraceae bacterium]